jgi:hypothetical protein
VLTPLASVGLALIMMGAAVTHLRRHETQAVAAPMILRVLTLVVAWARFGPYALSPSVGGSWVSAPTTTGGTVWPPVMWKSWSNWRYSLGSMSVRSALPSLSIGLPSSQVSPATNMARWVGVV